MQLCKMKSTFSDFIFDWLIADRPPFKNKQKSGCPGCICKHATSTLRTALPDIFFLTFSNFSFVPFREPLLLF